MQWSLPKGPVNFNFTISRDYVPKLSERDRQTGLVVPNFAEGPAVVAPTEKNANQVYQDA